MNSPQQMLLGFSARDDADFNTFYTTPSSRLVVSTLKNLVVNEESDFVYLSGNQDSGKSHLLQAACNHAFEHGQQTMYVPLADLADYDPAEILDNTTSVQCLALDDLEAIVGKPEWEEALFHLFNQRQAEQLLTLFAARQPARELAIELADLKSRLALCLGFQLIKMNDEEKAEFIQFRAKKRGIPVNGQCATYIIQRGGRSMQDLFDILEKLDQESLKAGRKITVPFIKSVFGW